jgi:hypothetical protein
VLAFFHNLRRQSRSVRELSRLSDRELADIGIHRAEIESVVRFAAETSRREMKTTSDPRSVAARSVEQGRLALQG